MWYFVISMFTLRPSSPLNFNEGWEFISGSTERKLNLASDRQPMASNINDFFFFSAQRASRNSSLRTFLCLSNLMILLQKYMNWRDTYFISWEGSVEGFSVAEGWVKSLCWSQQMNYSSCLSQCFIAFMTPMDRKQNTCGIFSLQYSLDSILYIKLSDEAKTILGTTPVIAGKTLRSFLGMSMLIPDST